MPNSSAYQGKDPTVEKVRGVAKAILESGSTSSWQTAWKEACTQVADEFTGQGMGASSAYVADVLSKHAHLYKTT